MKVQGKAVRVNTEVRHTEWRTDGIVTEMTKFRVTVSFGENDDVTFAPEDFKRKFVVL